jgi:uncharacterized protein (TIGR02679 family)
MRLSLSALDAALTRADLATSLRDALERLDGPIVERAAERARSDAAWAAVCAAVDEPRLARVLLDPHRIGLLKRLSRSDPVQGRALLAAAERVLQRLPAQGISRARLAAECVGDAHALDPGAGLAALVLAAAECPADRGGGAEATDAGASADVGGAADEDGAAGTSVRRARDRWASLGVAVNELAAPVLLLNLPVHGDGVGARCIEAACGEPLHLSLRVLLRAPPSWRVHGCRVFLCENPDVVVAAADRLGAGCAPLVCTDGMPAAAQRVLLMQLAAAGAALYYHGDFDWPGIGMGNVVMRRFGARPWRFTATDYVAAEGPPLSGRPVDALWDASLMPCMQAGRRALHEESVIEDLLQDLADARRL